MDAHFAQYVLTHNNVGHTRNATFTYYGGIPLSRDDDVFPGISKVLQHLHMVLLILGSLD